VRPPKQELPTLPNAIAGPSRMGGALAALRKPASDGARREADAAIDPSARGRITARPVPPRISSSTRAVASSAPPETDADDARSTRRPDEEDDLSSSRTSVKRDEDTLAIIEDLTPGPQDFGRDPDGGVGWEQVEPYSRLRLRCVITLVPLYPGDSG
jgi:hypothetical protein